MTARPTTLPILQKAATDLGVSFESTATAPTGPMSKLRKLRIGLMDGAGGGMPPPIKSCNRGDVAGVKPG